MNQKIRIPKQARSLNSQKKIIVAARKLFTEQGFHQIQAKHIAAAAGVSIGTFYQYFSDKKAVYSAILEIFFAEFEALNINSYFNRILSEHSLTVMKELINALEDWVKSFGLLYKDISVLAHLDDDINKIILQYEYKFAEILVSTVVTVFGLKQQKDAEKVGHFLFVSIDTLLSYLCSLEAGDAGNELKEETAKALLAYLRLYHPQIQQP